MPQVFLSYARLNSKPARRLATDLRQIEGVDVWFDRDSLMPGMKWRPAIRKAIRSADYFIALVSEASCSGPGFRNSELRQALEVFDEFPSGEIYLIPARLDECEMPIEELSEIQFVDLFPEWQEGVSRLSKVLKHRSRSTRRTEGTGDSNSVARSLHHYRVGLVDLDIGIPDLKALAVEWTSIQRFFEFTCPPLPRIEDAVKSFEGAKNFVMRRIPQSFVEEHPYLGVDLIACMTRYMLAVQDDGRDLDGYFSAPSDLDERFLFISAADLLDYSRRAGCTFDQALLYLIAGQLIAHFTDVGFHDKTRSCIMDFCDKRDDFVKGLKVRRLCNACAAGLDNRELRAAVDAFLAWTPA